jgi:hypothetical protein
MKGGGRLLLTAGISGGDPYRCSGSLSPPFENLGTFEPWNRHPRCCHCEGRPQPDRSNLTAGDIS